MFNFKKLSNFSYVKVDAYNYRIYNNYDDKRSKRNKDALSKIASSIPKYCEEYQYIQNFKLIGK